MKVLLLLALTALSRATETVEEQQPGAERRLNHYGRGGYYGGGYYKGYPGYGRGYGGYYPGYNWYGGGGGYPYYGGNYRILHRAVPPESTIISWYPFSVDSPPPIAVVGRPFRRELNGGDISADVVVLADDEKNARVWSRQEAIRVESNALRTTLSNPDAVSEWSTRAVGEHASIASFAAFTIALMTNKAPPALIRDALRAALDELDHAQVSFEMASLFTGGGQVIEPGALPDSKLSFSQNLTALALGVAQESCIDESLSALELAADANAMLRETDGVIIAAGQTTWKIATDESRHSMLAWRTIEWVCSVDEKVCDQVMREIVNTEHMQKSFEVRFSDRKDIGVGLSTNYPRLSLWVLPIAQRKNP